MMVWLGSAVVLLAATVLGIWRLEGIDRLLLIVAVTAAVQIEMTQRIMQRMTGGLADRRGHRPRVLDAG